MVGETVVIIYSSPLDIVILVQRKGKAQNE